MKNYNKNLQRIGIKFPDNDFYNTIRTFLVLLVVSEPSDLTKAKIVEMFNFCAPAMYVLGQSRDYTFDDHLKDYLRIEERHVYLDDEIDTMSSEWNNGEFTWIEKDGQIYNS